MKPLYFKGNFERRENNEKEKGSSTATLLILTPKHTSNTERIALQI